MPAPRPVRYRDLRRHIPPVGQIQALEGSAAGQGLYRQFRGDMGLLNLEAQRIRADRKLGIGEAREQGVMGVSAAAGEALERGTYGGSADFLTRQTIRDDTRASISGIKSQSIQALLQNLASRMGARQEYETGILNLLAMKRANQSTNAINQFYQGILGSYGGGGGGFGGGGQGQAGGGRVDRKIDRRTATINRLLENLSGTPIAGQEGIIDRLYEVFSARNKLLVGSGAKRRPRKNLKRRIKKALAEGGGYDGGPL